jgi:hypothetical protein
MPQLTQEQRNRLAIDPITGKAAKPNPIDLANQAAAAMDQQSQQQQLAPAQPQPQQTVAGGQPPTSKVSDYGQPALESIFNQMAPKAAPGPVGQKFSATE